VESYRGGHQGPLLLCRGGSPALGGDAVQEAYPQKVCGPFACFADLVNYQGGSEAQEGDYGSAGGTGSFTGVIDSSFVVPGSADFRPAEEDGGSPECSQDPSIPPALCFARSDRSRRPQGFHSYGGSSSSRSWDAVVEHPKAYYTSGGTSDGSSRGVGKPVQGEGEETSPQLLHNRLRQ